MSAAVHVEMMTIMVQDVDVRSVYETEKRAIDVEGQKAIVVSLD